MRECRPGWSQGKDILPRQLIRTIYTDRWIEKYVDEDMKESELVLECSQCYLCCVRPFGCSFFTPSNLSHSVAVIFFLLFLIINWVIS